MIVRTEHRERIAFRECCLAVPGEDRGPTERKTL